jgi:hypothetical protein
VTGIDANGGITAVSVHDPGSVTSRFGSPQNVNGGHGSGAALNIDYILTGVTVTAPGAGYSSAPLAAIVGGQAPGRARFGTGFSAPGTDLVPHGTVTSYNAAINLFGATNPAAYGLRVGDSLNFSHGDAFEVFILAEMSSFNASATVKVVSGGIDVKTNILITGGYPLLTNLLTFDDLQNLALKQAPNRKPYLFPAGFQLVVTSLTNADYLPVVGMLFATHAQEDIPFDSMQFDGPWENEPGYWDSPSVAFTDTVQAAVTIPFTGDYLEVFLQSGVASGISTATFDGYLDGVQIYTNAFLNRFQSNRFIFNAYFGPSPGFATNGPPGLHAAKLVLTQPEAAPAPQSRSMAIIGARQMRAH